MVVLPRDEICSSKEGTIFETKNDDCPIEDDQLQPASIEPRIGDTCYELDILVSPEISNLKRYGRRLNPDREFIIHPGKIYYLNLAENLIIPEGFEGISDTKSSIGRLGCPTTVYEERHGHILGNGNLEPWIVCYPQIFPLKLIPYKSRLTQIRIRKRNEEMRMSRSEIKRIYGEDISLSRNGDLMDFSEDILSGNSIIFTRNLDRIYVSKKGKDFEPIDVTLKNHYNPEDYFDVLENQRRLKLERNRLYLIGSNERVHLSERICGELVMFDYELGLAIKAHMAGFFDPGFNGEVTFEYLSLIYPIILEDGKYCGKLFLDRLSSPVMIPYGDSSYNSNYQNQRAPKLSKVFREDI